MRVASIGDHWMLSQRLRAWVTVSWIRSAIWSMSRFGIARCSGEVPMKVWMRGRFAWRTASQARSMSARLARARPQTTAFVATLAIWRHRLEVALGGDREAGLDDVDAHLVEERGDLQLLLERHGGAGRLLAVAERGVEDQDAVLRGRVGHGHVIPGLRGFSRRVGLTSERARRTRARSEAAKQQQTGEPAPGRRRPDPRVSRLTAHGRAVYLRTAGDKGRIREGCASRWIDLLFRAVAAVRQPCCARQHKSAHVVQLG